MQAQKVLLVGLTAGLAIGAGLWQAATAGIMPGRLAGLTIPMVSETAPIAMSKDAMAMSKDAMSNDAMAKPKAMAKVLMSGTFVAAEHPTEGGASVVMKDGKQYVMLDAKFKSEAGPDLHVLLHREATPKQYTANDYVNLGKLKQVAGAQLYEIPAGVTVGEYQSAVIWCEKFNATFGFAMLK
jgi:Electron transfer DM13